MFKIPYRSIRKIYKFSLLPVLPYSLSLAMLFILIEPKTKPTFSDTTDWMALCLFIIGLFVMCLLHACIVYQIVQSIPDNHQTESPRFQHNIFVVLGFGFKKMFPVFLMATCYLLLVALGFVALIIPGIFLFVVGLMSLFIIVLKNTNPKDAFIESYHLTAPHWGTLGLMFIGLTLLFTITNLIINFIFMEQVVFSTFFSVLVQGFLLPLAYTSLMTLLSEFSSARNMDTSIEDSLDSKSSRRNRKQKFLRTAPNQ